MTDSSVIHVARFVKVRCRQTQRTIGTSAKNQGHDLLDTLVNCAI